MKKALKYSGIVALLLAVVAFILMLVTPAIIEQITDSTQHNISGAWAIFGGTEKGLLVDTQWKPSVLALIGWILGLVGMLILCLGVILPLLKVKALEKFAGLLNLIAVGCLIVAGIFCFIVVPTFYAANELDVPNYAAIGAGWVIAGIVYILAGACAIAPAAADLIGKKK